MIPHLAAHAVVTHAAAAHAGAPATRGVLWASIIAAAVVAAAVTLIVEYAAKPRLEVRKERILEAARLRRDAIRGLEKASGLASALVMGSASGQPGTVMYEQRKHDMAAEAEGYVQAAARELSAPRKLSLDWVLTTGNVEKFTVRVRGDLPTGELWDDFREAAAKLRPYADLFRTPRWRWRRRRKLARRVAGMAQPGGTVTAAARRTALG